MRTLALACVLPALACAKPGPVAGAADVADSPSWSSADGRDQVRLDIARAMVEAGTPESALKVVGEMRADGQSGVELDVLQARALREIGLYEDAAELLERTLRRHPRNVELRKELGVLLADQDDIAGAIAQFEVAAKLAQTDAEVWNNLGFSLMAAGRHEDAVDALRTSLRLDSSRDLTRNNLGFALVALERTDEAWRIFRAGQGGASAHYNVGVGLELRGEVPRAKARYEKALELDPAHVGARDALSRLALPPPSEPDSPSMEAP